MTQLHKAEDHKYYCRACGRPLPPSSRRLFHPDCLMEDKRRRVRQRRQQQHERFVNWLRQQVCRKCGARCDESRSGVVAVASGEASQPPYASHEISVDKSPGHRADRKEK